ncbi:hypothetical protein [Aquimarina spongiae]|uniref:Entericidin EcnA/B family protein n=1 Tax=Aquimarina spongiae TaxID=570521 RepID=A0A1M6GLJ8_9FLAO|nr:hypothetical protein [Aquimarina spongiae]SHJ10808.1 hypothetical protein SAMN04488508_105340 [Aquimarina spongiae]
MKKVIITLFSFVFVATILTSCREKKSTGEKIKDGVEEVGEGIEEAAEEVKDEVDDATDGN